MREPSFNLVFADPNQPLINELETAFESYPNVTTRVGRFEDVDFDCVVSPANSFGLMDGGVDEAITMYFGEDMMKRVQREVIRQYGGEQPVGTSMIVIGGLKDKEGTDGAKKYQFVAHTPTMIIPMNIGHTTNVYMAFKAMLLAVENHNSDSVNIQNQIKTVVCPGMGTGAGRVPYNKAASAMVEAYKNVYNPPTEISWEFATTRYNSIVTAHTV